MKSKKRKNLLVYLATIRLIKCICLIQILIGLGSESIATNQRHLSATSDSQAGEFKQMSAATHDEPANNDKPFGE